jgi:hypothetical protein
MKILVIEDGFNHLAAARTFFATKPDVQVAYATTYSQARKYLAFDEPVSVDGIISDIFFPYHHESPHNNPEPIGVAVMIQARDKGIPCILNTAGYHHGSRYQWISGLQSELGLPQMVDQYSDDQYTEAEGKDWNKAYNRLVGIIGVAPLPSLAAHIKTGMGIRSKHKTENTETKQNTKTKKYKPIQSLSLFGILCFELCVFAKKTIRINFFVLRQWLLHRLPSDPRGSQSRPHPPQVRS